jgi:hypothetical protein
MVVQILPGNKNKKIIIIKKTHKTSKQKTTSITTAP